MKLAAQLTLAAALAAPTLAMADDRTPLMSAMDKAGLGSTLDKSNLRLGGFVEGSWTYNLDSPDSGVNVGRSFDVEDQDPTLNQVDLFLERTVDVTKKTFDVGFRMEWIWGGDSRFIHSNGLFDHYGFNDGPDEQFDLNQAYLDLAIPVGNGLRLRLGKYVTPFGFETINPTTTPFYSRSFLFSYAIPFTHTGAMATYAVDDNWSIEGGVFRGWEQSLEDVNDMVSFHAKVAYTSSDKKWSGILQVCTGPEQFDNESDYRTVVDAIFTYTVNDKLTLSANADYGWEANAATDGGTASWYGVTAYAAYVIDPKVTLNGRVEWFNDDDGARGLGTNVYEATIGLAIKPFAGDQYGGGLTIRPEFRWDHADADIFNDGDDDNQFTLAADIIYAF
jgi:hypothetical protein